MTWNDSYTLPPEVSEIDLAYTAGLLDGEGCISISKQKPNGWGRINTSHRLFVKITIGQEEVLNHLRELFQIGSIHIQRHKRYNDGYAWWIASLQAVALLRLLYPYLRIKHKEADIAFEFAETYWQRGSSNRLPPKVVQERERLYLKLQKAKPSYKFRHPDEDDDA